MVAISSGHGLDASGLLAMSTGPVSGGVHGISGDISILTGSLDFGSSGSIKVSTGLAEQEGGSVDFNDGSSYRGSGGALNLSSGSSSSGSGGEVKISAALGAKFGGSIAVKVTRSKVDQCCFHLAQVGTQTLVDSLSRLQTVARLLADH
jgi:hypothetical protein